MKLFHTCMKIIFCVVILSGCATTLTESEKETQRVERAYARESRELERLDRWYSDVAICRAQGGIMTIKRFHLPFGCRNGGCPPEHGDFYRCASSVSIQF